MRQALSRLAHLTALILFSITQLQAQTWTGTSSTAWGTSTNWSTGVPVSGGTATFDSAGNNNVAIDLGDEAAVALQSPAAGGAMGQSPPPAVQEYLGHGCGVPAAAMATRRGIHSAVAHQAQAPSAVSQWRAIKAWPAGVGCTPSAAHCAGQARQAAAANSPSSGT